MEIVERLVNRYIRDRPLPRKPLSDGMLHRDFVEYSGVFDEDQLVAKDFARGTFIDIQRAFNSPSQVHLEVALKKYSP